MWFRWLACAAAAAACAAPGVAQAHGGPTFAAGADTGAAPVLDGVVNPGEWADANAYSLTFGSLGNATVRFVHTPTDLYVAAVVQDPSPGIAPAFSVFFDDDHDGVNDEGEDAWRAQVGSPGGDLFFSPTGLNGADFYNDADFDAPNNTVAAATIEGNVMFELRHPLCSSDTTHDICASVGQMPGLDFRYERNVDLSANTPGLNLFDPSAGWAHLLLAAGDVVAPTASVTAPAAGSILRGTVDVAANASDNVGVTRVDFRYFDGATDQFVELGSDTDPPYTATFDTTQVGNTAVLDATIYAVAHDAAGNTGTFGNGVTVDNAAPSRIVFESDRDGNSEIYAMSPAGTGLTRLTSSPAVDTRPSLSPNGNLIAWQSDGQIWLMRSDGSNKQPLTSTATNDAPSFSPDGTKIAFHSNRSGDYDIWVMNTDGTAATNLSNRPESSEIDPTWSPDGANLAFDSDRMGSRDIFTMNAAGGEQTNLTPIGSQLDSDPDWSPDGSRLLFVSTRGGFTSVWSMNTSGEDLVNVTESANFDADPAWSPDGSHIVFTRAQSGLTFNVWTARPDGTAKLQVTNAASTQRNSFADWGSRPSETIVTLEPVADTFVRASDPTTAHGSETTFDVHAGASLYCSQGPGPAYGLLRFDLSSLPAGVQVTDARLHLTVAGGFAQDGDPVHYAIRLNSNDWSESVTWNGRPADGIVHVAPQPTINGTPLSLSQDVLGIGNAFNANCNAPTPPAVRTFTAPVNRPQSFANAVGNATGGALSMQIWSLPCGTPTTVPCTSGGSEKAYFLRYHSREATNPTLRPKLVVTYAPGVDVTSFTATPADPIAGLAQVDLEDVPPSVLLAPPRSTASTPLGDTPLGDTPLGDTPLGDTPLGDTPLGDTSLGLGALIAELRTVPLASLPLLRDGGWPAVLAGTTLADRALQNVSLGDLFAFTPRLAVLDDITLAELDYSRSSLGDVVTVAYALGNSVTLSELSFTNANLDPALRGWCMVTTTDCANTSVLALGLRGAPLGDTPLGDTPLGDTPLGDTPLGDTPLGDTPLGDTPLGDTPLGDTPLGDTDVSRAPLGDTPLGDTPLGDTNLNRAPLGDTPLGDTPVSELSCTILFVTCPTGGTLSQNLAHLRPNLKLRDLVASLRNPNNFTVAQLLAVLDPPEDYTLAQVAAIFKASSGVTFNDLLAAVLRAGAQWERIDLTQPALARVATGGGSVNLASELSVSGASILTFKVDLPSGWTAVGTPSIETVSPVTATALDVVDVQDVPGGGTRHTLRTPNPMGGDLIFHFGARPGTTLGPATASLSVAAGNGSPARPPAESVNVQETFEPNNDPNKVPPEAPLLAPGAMYLSYLTGADDIDYFRVTVPDAGTRTTIRLSHLPADYDLVVYGRQGTTPLVAPGGAAPLETPVLGDSGAPITHLTDALPAETLDDLTLLADRPVLGVSAFRTTEDEAVVAISDGAPGQYVIQVKGYNGATSVEPYMLRIESEAPRLAPTCPERFQNLIFPRAGLNMGSIPADADTVFLANGPQLAATGGQTALDWFTTANLNRLRATGHPSGLVRLEDVDPVADAYEAWNDNPCSSSGANAVVSAITDVVRTIRTERPSVRNLVLLGNDKALPFARLDDLTTIANEADYASTFRSSEDLYGALFEHRVLSDDPYGTTDPIPYLQRQLHVPQLAVGRLVETGGEISGALERFVSFGGVLDPTSARTSGYDFLRDGANGVAAAFADIVGAQEPPTTPALIGNDWTQLTLAGALSPGTGLFGMNGHADHHRLQPAAGTDLFSAANLPASLERAVVFSMGCHSGLSVSDAAVAATDWPQTFAGKGAAAYAGNLGYGYGDTVTVAYSEALNVRLAQGLRDGLPIGDALIAAKQGYLASLGVVGVYDEKAMSELALYGLPMWSLGTPPAANTPTLPQGVTRLSTDPDPATGLLVDRYRSQPPTAALARQNQPDGSAYWTGPSGVQVTHLRPLQPKAEFEVASDARGVLITGLESRDESPIDPVYSRPIVDSSGAEPELPFADVAFPAKIQSLVSQQTRNGLRATTVLVLGQFFSDDTADADGAGHQRLFTRIDLDVLRSSSADRLAPRFDGIEAVVLENSDIVSFSTDVVDLPSEGADNVKRVLVAFRDETSPTWRFLDLRRGTGASWGGTAATTGTRIEYFVQAVDDAGNVAVSTNKGILFAGSPPAAPSGAGVEPTLSGTQAAGWFTPSAQLDITAADGVAVSTSLDGGPLTPFTAPLTIDTDGLHTIEIRGSNGYEATLVAPVDTLPPTVALDNPGATVPLNGKVPLAFRCGDTASGVATCTAKVNGVTRAPGFEVPTTPLGFTHTIEVTATDRVGRPTTQTFTYKVGSREILFVNGSIGSGDIFSLPADAGLTTVPTRLTATSFPEADPAWSPDSRRIAFSSNRDGTWRVYVMDADGTDVTQLPTGSGNALDPAWSPDGNRIAFVSNRSGNFDIWVANVNGTGTPQRLTTDSKLDLAPSWAPSNQIVWANGPLLGLDIWKMSGTGSAIGSGKTRLTKTQDVAAETSSSPNGTIAFARRKGLRFEIWTMNASGGSQVKAVGTGRWDVQPSWLQDGKLVFASGIDENRDFDLYRATKTTSWSFARITNAAGNERAPNG